MTEYMSAFLLAMTASLFATPLVMRLASKTGALDVPDARKVHKKPVPRIGGVGIYAAFIVSMVIVRCIFDLSGVSGELLKGISGLILSGTLIMLVGVIDDYRNLPAKVKLLGQIFAAAVLVIGFDVRIAFITDPFGDYIYLEWFAVPATIFWLVGLSNTINLIDGLDGLAAGVSMLAALTIMFVALEQNVVVVAVLTAALAGAAFGFLFFNFNPASIFMGDSGSLMLGMLLGTISLLGRDLTHASIRERSTGGISHIPEDRHKHGLVLDYTLEDNIVLQRYFEPDFVSKGGFLKRKAIRDYANALIEQYDVRSGQGPVTTARSMSGGNQQKAIIAREIDRGPELLIAVQPTRGLDVGAIEYIHRQIVKVRDQGKGVLLVSLELDEVMALSDRILVMYEGEIVGELDPATATAEELGLYMAGAKRKEA